MLGSFKGFDQEVLEKMELAVIYRLVLDRRRLHSFVRFAAVPNTQCD